jgi:hypothetical protein
MFSSRIRIPPPAKLDVVPILKNRIVFIKLRAASCNEYGQYYSEKELFHICSSFSSFSLMVQNLRSAFFTFNFFSMSSLLFINRKWGRFSWTFFWILSARANLSLSFKWHLRNMYLEYLIVFKVSQHFRCSKLNLCLPVIMMLLTLISKTLRFFLKTLMPKGWRLLRLLVSIKIWLEPFL